LSHFFYKALDSDGHVVHGKKHCADRAQLVHELVQSGLLLVSYRRCWFSGFGLKQKKEFEDFTHALEFQLGANISLLDSLQLISRAQRSTGSTLAKSLLTSVKEGRSLSDVTAEQPDVFGRLAPALLGVGERTGNMVGAVSELHRSLVHSRRSRQRLRQAIIYPVTVACVLILVAIFMLFLVIPDLVNLLVNLNVELPPATRLIHALSIFVREQFERIVVVLGSLIVVASMLIRHPRTKMRVQQWQFSIPVLGPLLLEIRLARFSRSLAVLISTGINLLDSLETAKPVLEQPYLENELSDVKAAVLSGTSLSSAMHQRNKFPSNFARLIEIGESTGMLSPMLHHAADGYDQSCELKIRQLEFWSTSILLVFLGLLLIGIVMSVLGPLYGSFSQVQAF